MTDDTNESPVKRQRLHDDESSGPSTPLTEIKSRVCEEIMKLGDQGEVAVSDLCVDLIDRPAVKAVLDELEREHRIIVNDGVVYFSG
jgi:hypothetical protein